MNVIDATAQYEQWARNHAPLIPADLKAKRRAMTEEPFGFFRATYYRWAQIWEEFAGELSEAPDVLSVGDLHVENFGTWRDAEGRLVWGVNDFDEADRLPFPNDLTRLCVSAVLTLEIHGSPLRPQEAIGLIVDGYRDGIDSGGVPFVLEEKHRSLRDIAYDHIKDAQQFWAKLNDLDEIEERLPSPARRLLARLLPRRTASVRLVHRVAGLGSLGRRRYAAIGVLTGGLVAREVKELLPAATVWARGGKSRRVFYSDILKHAVRCRDPFLVHSERWVGRRLSPSNGRIDLAYLRKADQLDKVLHSMGVETANIHLGGRGVKQLRRALGRIKSSTFLAVVRDLTKSVIRDWKSWRSR
jgi:uncharacterized protein (DUF2252 family)